MNTKPVEVKHAAPAARNDNDLWHSFRREIDNVFDRFAGGLDGWNPFGNIERLWPRNGFISLAMDIDETDAAYKLSAELPGLDEKDVEVSVKGGTLVIEGEKRSQSEEKGKGSYLSERSYGAFRRSLTLPDDVDADKVQAQFGKGVLTVTLPKTAAAARKIEVKAA